MERRTLAKCIFWGIVVLVQIHGSRGCFKEEKLALLEIKAFIKSNGATDSLLRSWVGDTEIDCCNWEQLTCNFTSGHVIELSLNNIQIPFEGLPSKATKIWFLNVSLLWPFKELRSLNLSNSAIGGWVGNEGFSSLSRLKELETLDLGHNRFNRSVFTSLSSLTSLKTLILASNDLAGYFPAEELSTLENLEMLDLGSNGLNFSQKMQDSIYLSKLRKLKRLNLSKNDFYMKTLRYLGSLSTLTSLDLRKNQLEGQLSKEELTNLSKLEVLILQYNYLNGTLPIEDLVTYSRLEILDLSSNELTGSVPQSIGALSSLKALSLSRNKLNGSLPTKGLCELKKLEELDLSENNFEGNLPLCLNNLLSLRLLDLSQNNFTGNVPSSLLEFVRFISDNSKFEIETENPGWKPMFQLKVLVLSNCNLNKLDKGIPTFLFHQYNLLAVDLSQNNLAGRFPDWLLQNNTGLKFVMLQNNSFMGQLHLPPYPNMNLSGMDVSDNHFDGQLPKNIGTILPRLRLLHLSGNAFQGPLPSSIANMSDLERLDVSFNFFSGEVPEEFLSHCFNLVALDLSNNDFHGQLFSEHSNNLTNLEVLNLNNNQFTGTISGVVSKCFNLFILHISNNYMSGKIPALIGNMTELRALDLRNNSFEGQVSCELISRPFLDLSHNSFSGTLPKCLMQDRTRHIYLQGNNLTGSLPNAFLNSSFLRALDLRDNSLTGNIPFEIGSLHYLKVLMLAGNHFSGFIPNQLCQLNYIGLLDLSRNSLSNSIPSCLGNMTFGKAGVNNLQFGVYVTFSGSLMHDSPMGLDFQVQGSLLEKVTEIQLVDSYIARDEVEFVTKSRPDSYKGKILDIMFGLDLSCNNLTGEIPDELGNLSSILGLNLSHNHLTGSIPKTFSKLAQIESMDLSYNNLTGEIPSELIDLNFLEVFSVAYNNLTGRIPDMKAQFGTFDNSSYKENPFLCGPPLAKGCTSTSSLGFGPVAAVVEESMLQRPLPLFCTAVTLVPISFLQVPLRSFCTDLHLCGSREAIRACMHPHAPLKDSMLRPTRPRADCLPHALPRTCTHQIYTC
ncbi:hypothetical protein ACB094_05G072900 [Castanea mollissima]